MKKFIAIIGLLVVSHLSIFLTGTMCHIEWNYPHFSWREDTIELQQISDIDVLKVQPIDEGEEESLTSLILKEGIQ